MINDDLFKFSIDLYIKNFLNERSLTLLKILRKKSKNIEFKCFQFLEEAQKFMSKSSFFRYLYELRRFNLIKKVDLGVKIDGHKVNYEITSKGLFILRTYEKNFGI